MRLTAADVREFQRQYLSEIAGVARRYPALTGADGRLALGFAEKVLEEVAAWHAAGAVLNVP